MGKLNFGDDLSSKRVGCLVGVFVGGLVRGTVGCGVGIAVGRGVGLKVADVGLEVMALAVGLKVAATGLEVGDEVGRLDVLNTGDAIPKPIKKSLKAMKFIEPNPVAGSQPRVD